MAALVPFDGECSRRRHHRGISETSDTEEWIKCRITVAREPPFSDDTRKRKASAPEASVPELSNQIVIDILVRLPVKSLLRCSSVCKAWRTIIFDPVFIREHLRCSTSRWEEDPTFIITPITFDRVNPGEACPTNFSNHIRFYRWQQSDSNGEAARFMHAKDFGGEFNRVCYFAHCDGLVLAPTDTKIYLFNPATREAITLPDSDRNNLRYAKRGCHCAGLGLDPHTGKYKVVQAFYRCVYTDFLKDVYIMGMEVFTIDGGDDSVWMETMNRPPYPVANWQTGLHIKGFMYWRIDSYHHCEEAPRGLLRLSLVDEEFDVTRFPESLDPALDDDCSLDVLHGRELCLTARTGDELVTIWMMPVDDEGGQGQWERRYSVCFRHLCHPMALVASGHRLLLWRRYVLYSHDLVTSELTTVCRFDRIRYQGRRARKWKNLWNFNVRPYTESLVRLNPSAPPKFKCDVYEELLSSLL